MPLPASRTAMRLRLSLLVLLVFPVAAAEKGEDCPVAGPGASGQEPPPMCAYVGAELGKGPAYLLHVEGLGQVVRLEDATLASLPGAPDAPADPAVVPPGWTVPDAPAGPAVDPPAPTAPETRAATVPPAAVPRDARRGPPAVPSPPSLDAPRAAGEASAHVRRDLLVAAFAQTPAGDAYAMVGEAPTDPTENAAATRASGATRPAGADGGASRPSASGALATPAEGSPEVADPREDVAVAPPVRLEAPALRAAAEPSPAAAGWVRGAAAAAVGALLIPVLWALYHRIQAREATAHATRGRILRELTAGPATATELGRRLGVDRTSAAYHLRVLARAGLVASAPAGRERRWYLGVAPRDAALSAGARRVLGAVRAAPGESVSSLARALASSKSTVHHHVVRLAAAGLVRVERDGRAARVRPA